MMTEKGVLGFGIWRQGLGAREGQTSPRTGLEQRGDSDRARPKGTTRLEICSLVCGLVFIAHRGQR